MNEARSFVRGSIGAAAAAASLPSSRRCCGFDSAGEMKGNKNKKFLSEKLKIYMQMFSCEKCGSSEGTDREEPKWGKGVS